MNWNQNETAQLRSADCGLRSVPSRDLTNRRRCIASRLTPHSEIRNPKYAFTLTELLVVITIIAILAGLVTAAAVNALNKGKQTAITLELQQLSGAIEDFKNTYGAYPPNALNPGERNMRNDRIEPIVQNDFERMFKKAFPRHQEPPELILQLMGHSGATGGLSGGMTSTEALVFWLGGFSKDPQYPISGPGGPSFADTNGDNSLTFEDEQLEGRNFDYEFDLGRLLPRTSDGIFDGRFIEYPNPLPTGGATRRINFWLYPPSNSRLPFLYCDTSRHIPVEYDVDLSGLDTAANIFAPKKLREGIPVATNNDDIRFVNDDTFQILHCGIDDAWGDFSVFDLPSRLYNGVITFPEGPFIGDIADTVGNFMTGTLEDAQE